MILSAFSHANMLHMVLNMYVLNTFAPVSIDRFFGVDQVCFLIIYRNFLFAAVYEAVYNFFICHLRLKQ